MHQYVVYKPMIVKSGLVSPSNMILWWYVRMITQEVSVLACINIDHNVNYCMFFVQTFETKQSHVCGRVVKPYCQLVPSLVL